MRRWRVLFAVIGGLSAAAENLPRPAAAPDYSSGSVVNTANYAPGPLAPNGLGTIFGTDLSFDRAQGTGTETTLGGVRVFVASFEAPLLYVSPNQINFVVPNNLRPGEVKVRVARQGVTGPEVKITVLEAAPALFRSGESATVIAAHADFSLVTDAAPARAGETVVLYATGLGLTAPGLPLSGAPSGILWIKRPEELHLTLNGRQLDASRLSYAGVAPGWIGLYQINVTLPDDTLTTDPEIRVAIGDQQSMAGLKLPLH
jgi:uncharacterized protein (TIGR03437 family)